MSAQNGGVGENGAEEGGIVLSDEQVQSLEAVGKDVLRYKLAENIQSSKLMAPLYDSRRGPLKSIPSFWSTALANHFSLASLLLHEDDKKALSFLEDVWVSRDPDEYRCFTIEFHFGSNPYFSNTVLKKSCQRVPVKDESQLKKDDLGVSQANLDFSLDDDTELKGTDIEWKDASKALTKLYPIVMDPEEPEGLEEFGSFFNIFGTQLKMIDFEESIIEVWEDPVEFFYNRAEGTIGQFQAGDDEEFEDEDEDDEDDEDDDKSIDLEQPERKRQRK